MNDVVAISASSALTCISCLTISTRVVGVGTYINRYCSDPVFLESEREREGEKERERKKEREKRERESVREGKREKG